MIYGELGVHPLSIDIKTRMINYWAKLSFNSGGKVCSHIYRLINCIFSSSYHTFHSKWLFCIKRILDDCGFSNIFDAQRNINILWLKLSVKRRLTDHFIQTWNSDVFNSPKGISYRIFKQDWKFEDYLDKLGKKDRVTFCRFRTTNHHLPIETGRWNSVNRENRKCTLCNCDDLGMNFIIYLIVLL